MTIQKLRHAIHESPFNKFGKVTDFDIRNFYRNLRFYAEGYALMVPPQELIASMTPAFQRDNDKWHQERQKLFVQNMMAGYQSEIVLYSLDPDINDKCMILDGLQRLTAIDAFHRNDFPIFDDIYFADISSQPRAAFSQCRMKFKVIHFRTEKEVVQHYIDINEGISHSAEDIERAALYLHTRARG